MECRLISKGKMMADAIWSRRDFMKLMAACTACGCGGCNQSASRENAIRRPNVVFILTDDQGTIDANCYGATDLHTPGIDRLAIQGTRFTQFYSAAPVCSPSRAALLTGRYPQRAQLTGNAPSQRGNGGMPTDQITIAEVMRQAGYATAHIGKWHLGYNTDTMPNAQGFDYSFGHMGGCIDNYSHYFYWNGPNLHDLWQNGREVWRDGKFFGDLMLDECCRFIDKNRTRPFFLYWAINMPHYPLQGSEKYRQMYSDMDEPRRSYAAFVSTTDEMIAGLLDHLDRLRLRDNTIVVFMSDHGHSEEIRNNFGGSGGSAGAHRGHKFTLWEGGVRVPCIISWPGRIPAGAVRSQMAASIDWLPTIAAYCGFDVGTHRIDGRDITAVIDSDASSPHEALHWQTGGHWAVRKGPWKLVHNGPASTFQGRQLPQVETFLANLAEDLSETRNFAENHPKVVAELAALHEQWAADVHKQ